MLSLTRALLLVASLVSLSSPAQSQTCSGGPLPPTCQGYAFSVDLVTVADPGGIFGAVGPGTTITGTFTIDTTALDIVPGAERGHYDNALECVRIDFPDRVLSMINTPVPPDADPDDTDPAIDLRNDVVSSMPPFTVFTDTVTMTMAGFGEVEVGTPPVQEFDGGGGFGVAYGDTCVQGVQTPCPPTVIEDDMLPVPGPGDVSALPTAFFELDFQSLVPIATGNLFGDYTDISEAEAIPCPEPGVATSFLCGVALLAGLTRRRHARTGAPADAVPVSARIPLS